MPEIYTRSCNSLEIDTFFSSQQYHNIESSVLNWRPMYLENEHLLVYSEWWLFPLPAPWWVGWSSRHDDVVWLEALGELLDQLLYLHEPPDLQEVCLAPFVLITQGPEPSLLLLLLPDLNSKLSIHEWCFRTRCCTVRLYWAGDNLGW